MTNPLDVHRTSNYSQRLRYRIWAFNSAEIDNEVLPYALKLEADFSSVIIL
jgi:hypothetical protein